MTWLGPWLLVVVLLGGCAYPQYAGCSKPPDPKDPSWCFPPADPFAGWPNTLGPSYPAPKMR